MAEVTLSLGMQAARPRKESVMCSLVQAAPPGRYRGLPARPDPDTEMVRAALVKSLRCCGGEQMRNARPRREAFYELFEEFNNICWRVSTKT